MTNYHNGPHLTTAEPQPQLTTTAPSELFYGKKFRDRVVRNSKQNLVDEGVL